MNDFFIRNYTTKVQGIQSTLYMVCFISLISLSHGANTYYVTQNGNDTANGLSESTAWLTLTKANATVMDGDTVLIGDGIYSGQIRPGNASRRTNVTYAAMPGSSPVIAGYWPSTQLPAALFQGDYNITLDGLTFSNNFRHVVASNSDYLKLYNCSFGYSGSTSEYSAVAIRNSRFAHVSNCTFRLWGRVTPSGNDHGTLLVLGVNSDPVTNRSGGHLVEDSTFAYGGHDVMQICASSNVVRRNVFYNDNWMMHPNGERMHGNRGVELLGANGSRNLIEQNVFAYTGIPPDQTNLVVGLEICTRNNIVRDNILYNMRGPGMALYSKEWGNAASNNCVYNNTFLNTGYDNAIRNDARAAIWFVHAGTVGNQIINNYSEVQGPAGFLSFHGTTAERQKGIRGNIWAQESLLFDKDALPDIDSFKFPALHLDQGSPLVNVGEWLARVTSETGTGTTITVDDADYFLDGWGIPQVEGDSIRVEGHPNEVFVLNVDYESRQLELSEAISWQYGAGVSLAFPGNAPHVGMRKSQKIVSDPAFPAPLRNLK